MKFNFIKAVLGLLLSALTINGFAQEKSIASLTELTWKNRIILVNNESSAINLLKKNKAEINDRDIIWFVITTEKIHTNYPDAITHELGMQIKKHFTEEEQNIILLGKDGDVKSTNNNLNLTQLFALIDMMPMRMQEMRSAN